MSVLFNKWDKSTLIIQDKFLWGNFFQTFKEVGTRLYQQLLPDGLSFLQVSEKKLELSISMHGKILRTIGHCHQYNTII